MTAENADVVLAKYYKGLLPPHEAMKASDKFIQIFIICGVIAAFGLVALVGEIIFWRVTKSSTIVEVFQS